MNLQEAEDAIVAVCNDATARGEQLTLDEIRDAVLAGHPDLQPALFSMATHGAARRLREEAERCNREAAALEGKRRR